MFWTVAVGILLMRATIPAPPSWAGALRLGCDATQFIWDETKKEFVPDPSRFFHVNVSVEFADGHKWARSDYAVREQSERNKALADCDRWMKIASEQIKGSGKK